VSQTELKQQLVDCMRMPDQSDIIDYNGHCSIRVAVNPILINVGSCQRSRLTVEDTGTSRGWPRQLCASNKNRLPGGHRGLSTR